MDVFVINIVVLNFYRQVRVKISSTDQMLMTALKPEGRGAYNTAMRFTHFIPCRCVSTLMSKLRGHSRMRRNDDSIVW